MNSDGALLNTCMTDAELRNEIAYWLDKLKGNFVMGAVASDYEQPEIYRYKKDVLCFSFSDDLLQRILSMSKGSEYGIYIILLSGVFHMLYSYNGSRDMVLGMPIFKQEVKAGFVNNMVALRGRIDEVKTCREFLSDIRNTVLEADKHQNMPFDMLAGQLDKFSGSVSRYLFDTVVLLESIHEVKYIEEIDFPLKFIFSIEGNTLKIDIHYNSFMYKRGTIQEIAGRLRDFYHIAMENPGTLMLDIDILSRHEFVTYDFSSAGTGKEDGAPAPPEIIKINNNWPQHRIYQVDTPSARELKIEIQREITVSLHRALPLCIILADTNLHPWYYERYNNIFSVTDKNDFLTMDYLECWAPYREIINEISLGAGMMEKESDIIHFVNEKIDQGYYLNIAVDEYYLPGKAKYEISHFIHHVLVYGYDNAGKKIKAVGFNAENLFDAITFDYECFSRAYEQGKLIYAESAPWASRAAVQLFYSNGFDCPYPFNPKKVVKQLHDYLNSEGDDSVIYYWAYDREMVTYGFKVYDVFLKHLEDFLQCKYTTDYRAMHLLAEHKKVIAEKLRYIIDRYQMEGRILELYKEFLKVVEMFNEIRLKSFGLLYGFDFQYGFNYAIVESKGQELAVLLMQIIEKVRSAREKEWIVLSSIYELLKEKFDGKLF